MQDPQAPRPLEEDLSLRETQDHRHRASGDVFYIVEWNKVSKFLKVIIDLQHS